MNYIKKIMEENNIIIANTKPSLLLEEIKQRLINKWLIKLEC